MCLQPPVSKLAAKIDETLAEAGATPCLKCGLVPAILPASLDADFKGRDARVATDDLDGSGKNRPFPLRKQQPKQQSGQKFAALCAEPESHRLPPRLIRLTVLMALV